LVNRHESLNWKGATMSERPLSERVRGLRDDYDDPLHFSPGPEINVDLLADEIAALEAENMEAEREALEWKAMYEDMDGQVGDFAARAQEYKADNKRLRDAADVYLSFQPVHHLSKPCRCPLCVFRAVLEGGDG